MITHFKKERKKENCHCLGLAIDKDLSIAFARCICNDVSNFDLPEIAEMPVTGRKADTLLLQQGANDDVEEEEEETEAADDPLPSSTISTLVASSSLIAASPPPPPPLPSKVLVLLLKRLEMINTNNESKIEY